MWRTLIRLYFIAKNDDKQPELQLRLPYIRCVKWFWSYLVLWTFIFMKFKWEFNQRNNIIDQNWKIKRIQGSQRNMTKLFWHILTWRGRCVPISSQLFIYTFQSSKFKGRKETQNLVKVKRTWLMTQHYVLMISYVDVTCYRQPDHSRPFSDLYNYILLLDLHFILSSLKLLLLLYI